MTHAKSFCGASFYGFVHSVFFKVLLCIYTHILVCSRPVVLIKMAQLIALPVVPCVRHWFRVLVSTNLLES